MDRFLSPEKPISRLLNLLGGGCRHRNTSQVFAVAAGAEDMLPSNASHYLVCFDCGRKIAYDWENMRRME
jgi:hypothetical protein